MRELILCIFILSITFNDHLYSFVPSPTWSSINQVMGPTGNQPVLAVNASGFAVAVWVNTTDSPSSLQASTLVPGGTWSEPQIVFDLGYEVSSPTVAVDINGNAIAVWFIDVGGSTTAVQSAYLPAGSSSWIPAEDNLRTIPTDSATPPLVGFDGAGNAIAVWGTLGTTIQSSKYLYGTTSWIDLTDLDSLTGTDDLVFAINAQGQAVIAWVGETTLVFTVTHLYTSLLDAGESSWSTPFEVASCLTKERQHQVAIDPVGNAVVVYCNLSNPFKILADKYYVETTSWEITSTLSNPTADSENPQVVIDSFGNAVAIWSAAVDSSTVIQSSKLSFDSLTWTPPTTISPLMTDFTLDNNLLKLAIDPQNNIFAAWMNVDGEINQIQGNTSSNGTKWGHPFNIVQDDLDFTNVPSGDLGQVLSIGAASNLYKLVTFLTTPNDPSQFVLNSNFTVPNPPLNFKAKTEKTTFLFQTEYARILSWSPSTSSNVVFYRVKYNGNLVATIPSGAPLKLTLHNQSKKATYSVTAVWPNGIEGVPAILTF